MSRTLDLDTNWCPVCVEFLPSFMTLALWELTTVHRPSHSSRAHFSTAASRSLFNRPLTLAIITITERPGYRTHPKAVTCDAGTLPRNSKYPADAIFALALLGSPATISLDVGSNHYQWNAAAGASIGSVAFPTQDAQIPYIQIIRNGSKVKDGYGSNYITKQCSFYNFNPFVGVIG